MSIKNFIDQLKSNIETSIDQHRGMLGQMTHVLDVNNRFSFIQGLEAVVKLVENIAIQPQFLDKAAQPVEDAVKAAVSGVESAAIQTVTNAVSE